MTPPVRMVAIDPGEIHVGVAVFIGARCSAAYELEPWDCIQQVEGWLRNRAIDVLVVEGFKLYANKAKEMIGSSFKTVELIGVLRYLHAVHGAEVEWKEQMADIKDPCRRILKAKRVKSMAKASGAGAHAADAELHGYHYLGNSGPRANPKSTG